MYQMESKVNKTLYPAMVVLKAAYAFIDRYYVHIDEDEEHWVIRMSAKSGMTTGDQAAEFENELLSQAVRCQIFEQTKSIREILLARAMASTMVDHEDPISRIQTEQDEISGSELDRILTDWFDDNEH